MTAALAKPFLSERTLQFVKFCLVGGSGTLVDMGVLYLLADPRTLVLNVAISKVCAAEVALVNLKQCIPQPAAPASPPKPRLLAAACGIHCFKLRYLSHLSKWAHSFTRLFTILRTVTWAKLDRLGLLAGYGTAKGSFRNLARPDQAYFPGFL